MAEKARDEENAEKKMKTGLPGEKILELMEGAALNGHAEVVSSLGIIYKELLPDDRAATKALHEAVISFKKAGITFEKNRRAKVETKAGKDMSYDYSDLANNLATVETILAENGLTLSYNTSSQTRMVPEKDYNGNLLKMPNGDPLTKEVIAFVEVRARLTHILGASMESSAICPVDLASKLSPPQAVKSATTFAKRESMESLLGISPSTPDPNANKEEKLSSQIKNDERASPSKPSPLAQASSGGTSQEIPLTKESLVTERKDVAAESTPEVSAPSDKSPEETSGTGVPSSQEEKNQNAPPEEKKENAISSPAQFALLKKRTRQLGYDEKAFLEQMEKGFSLKADSFEELSTIMPKATASDLIQKLNKKLAAKTASP